MTIISWREKEKSQRERENLEEGRKKSEKNVVRKKKEKEVRRKREETIMSLYDLGLRVRTPHSELLTQNFSLRTEANDFSHFLLSHSLTPGAKYVFFLQLHSHHHHHYAKCIKGLREKEKKEKRKRVKCNLPTEVSNMLSKSRAMATMSRTSFLDPRHARRKSMIFSSQV